MDVFSLSSGILNNKHIRLLVKESHFIFSNLQKEKDSVIESSRKYRSILHECVENVKLDPIFKGEDLLVMFHELEVIWSLCEILMIDVRKTGILISQLKGWIKLYSEEPDEHAKSIFELIANGNYQLNADDDQTKYWNLVTKQVLLGNLRNAIQLLQCHYNFESSKQIRLVASMLERMPSPAQYIVHEFYEKWNKWLEHCQTELSTKQFDDSPELLNIVKVLCQDTKVYETLSNHFDNWFQLMVTFLIYNDPCIRDTNITDLCKLSISIFSKEQHSPSYIPSDDFNQIIIAAFEYDLMKVVSLACTYFSDDYWFVSHFIDLLHHSKQLKVNEIIESEKVREYFILDYSRILFGDPTLWMIGISYLDYCQTSGIHYLELLLPKIHLDLKDDAKANKLIAIAKKRNLASLSGFFSLSMARKWLLRCLKFDETVLYTDDRMLDNVFNTENKVNVAECITNGMYWAIKSEDVPIITKLSDLYLLFYSLTKEFPCSLSSNLGKSMLIAERLAFASKYYEFRQLIGVDKVEAANLFNNLLSSKIYPKFFVKNLIEDANFLLQIEPELLFNTEKTFQMMKYFEEVATMDISKLRQNLVKNLSKAVIS